MPANKTVEPNRRLGRTARTATMTQWQLNNRYHQSLNCLQGHGVAKDEARAFTLNTEAAHESHSDAVLAMGWFYLNGVGVERDVERARKRYRQSARLGDTRAMFSLGQIAYGERDFAGALTWFRRASDAGHTRSLYWLGKLHWRGHGVVQDKKQAMRSFHRAASSKVREAQRVLRLLQ
jgi:uncharacterized protein